MSDWNRVPLKAVAGINERTLPESTPPDFEFRYVDISSVGRGRLEAEPQRMTFEGSPSRARRLVRAGDTIMSTVRTYLRAVWPVHESDNPESLVVSTGFAVLTPRELDPRYFAWYAQSDPFIEEVVARSNGISYPAINATDLGRFRVPKPPAVAQRAIADFLDAETSRIDALLDKKRHLARLVDERVSAMINERLDGLGPWQSLRRGVRPERDALIAGPFGSDLSGRDLLAVGAVGVFDQEVVITEDFAHPKHYVDGSDVQRLRRFGVRPGDVLVTGRGTIGRAATCPAGTSGIMHPCLLRVRTDDALLNAEFLTLVLRRSHRVRDFFHLSSTATTISVIYSSTLAATPIPMPHRSEQMATLSWAHEVTSRAAATGERLRRQIDLLIEHRRALITAAVTGELSVPGAAA